MIIKTGEVYVYNTLLGDPFIIREIAKHHSTSQIFFRTEYLRKFVSSPNESIIAEMQPDDKLTKMPSSKEMLMRLCL